MDCMPQARDVKFDAQLRRLIQTLLTPRCSVAFFLRLFFKTE